MDAQERAERIVGEWTAQFYDWQFSLPGLATAIAVALREAEAEGARRAYADAIYLAELSSRHVDGYENDVLYPSIVGRNEAVKEIVMALRALPLPGDGEAK